MGKRLVIAGAGHAHMLVMARLKEFVTAGHRVTVIAPCEYHYYSGMGPGMLGGFYRPAELRFPIRRLTERLGGRFLLGEVASIDPAGQTVHLTSQETTEYDLLSCNLGSQIKSDMVDGQADDIYPVKPIEALHEARCQILAAGQKRPLRIGVIGAGPSGVEIAGNLWRLGQQPGMRPVTVTLYTASRLLTDFPVRVRRIAEASLRQRKIEIRENCRIRAVGTGQLTDIDGENTSFDILFLATGLTPSRVFADSAIATGTDGGMLVNQFLQSTQYPEIFGGGDCISFQPEPLAKVGVYAVRQNPVLCHNLMATLEQRPLRPFVPGGSYLTILNLGDGTGLLHKWSLTWHGRLAFRVKDAIDRRFVRTFR
ncbi:MAG: NAD(P)/FAD-dependent oxidoreductase [Desulfopila sp.]